MADSGKKPNQLMGLFGCLGVMVVLFALLLAGTWFVISNTEDQSDLNDQVEVQITDWEDRRKGSAGHTIDYHYRVDGEQFVHRTWLRNSSWMPGEPLSACVAPDHPERHVLRVVGTETCGDDFVGFQVETAEPAP